MNREVRKAQGPKPGVESLEGRAVLSTVSAAVIAPPVSATADAPVATPVESQQAIPTALVRGASYLRIEGSARGTAQTLAHNPDVGNTVVLLGSGRVQGLGQVLITGKLHGTGNIAAGTIGGELTISDAKGNLTLKLVGPTARGFSAPKSGPYRFSVEHGTGSFAHEVADGTVALDLTAKTFHLAFHGSPNRY